MDFSYTPKVEQLRERTQAFFDRHITPNEARVEEAIAESRRLGKPWTPIALFEELKAEARAQGLWNLFLPRSERAPQGLSNLEYAPLCEIMGRCEWAPEIFNCSAPDTGNMEVLERYGSEAQKDEWLEPLLAGKIRSAFLMTEPAVASSDATNIECSIRRDGDDYVINGRKWFSSGAGDPRCRIYIVMGKTDPEQAKHRQQSMILVPADTPGIEVLRPVTVFGYDDAPHGHMHLRFTDCRVPADNVLLGEGRGFEISQVRLGPGRIHHCMRSIGAAERAIGMLAMRGLTREAFGKRIANLGKNTEVIARARVEIEAMRMMVLKAAKAMDVLGNREARVWVSAVKAMVPERVCHIIDEAIQIHGATGVSQWTPLADLYASQRTLRLADGPDEVHWFVVGRAELASWEEAAQSYDPKAGRLGAPAGNIFSGP